MIYRNELRNMLAQHSKAEIELVCECGVLTGGRHPLVSYLDSRMREYFMGEKSGNSVGAGQPQTYV
jgi:hypothetical protein